MNGVPVFNMFDGSRDNVAKRLKAGGYHTGMIGKWHLGASPTFHPNSRGFDYFYGFLAGETSQWEPRLYENQTAIEPPHDEKYHLTEDMADKAIAMADLIAEGLPMMRNVGQHSAKLHALTGELTALEGEADDLNDKGLSALFKGPARQDALAFVCLRTSSSVNTIS